MGTKKDGSDRKTISRRNHRGRMKRLFAKENHISEVEYSLKISNTQQIVYTWEKRKYRITIRFLTCTTVLKLSEEKQAR